MIEYGLYFCTYLIIVSLAAVALTVHDKKAAIKGNWRISEQMLIFVAMLGGSAAMLYTMKKIRHKTKHALFMVGIPVIILFQVAAIVFLCILNS
jgi:Predicted membrane protein